MKKAPVKQIKAELQVTHARFWKVINEIAAQGIVLSSEEEYNNSEHELHKEYVQLRDHNNRVMQELKDRRNKKK